jgi:hypothetical protein
MLMFRDPFGSVRIMEQEGRVASSLAQLEKMTEWEGLAQETMREMFVVEGVTARYVSGTTKALLVVAGVVNVCFTGSGLLQNAAGLLKRVRDQFSNWLHGQRKDTTPDLPATHPQRFRTTVSVPPVTFLTGVLARLKNLGYYEGPISSTMGPNDIGPASNSKDPARAAIRGFQSDFQLIVDGIPGPQTQETLRIVHREQFGL